MTFQQELFKVGYTQATSFLPLVFITNDKINRLVNTDRLRAMQLTEPVKSTLRQMLSSQGIKPIENNIRDMLISNFECLVTFNKSDEDLNKVFSVLDSAFNSDKELSSQDGNYLQRLNRVSVQTNYATLNKKLLEIYWDKFKEEPLPTRLINAQIKAEQLMFKSDQTTDTPTDFLMTPKVDLNIGKITNMTKPKQLLSLVPIHQVVGYVTGLYEVMKNNLIEVEYFRTDFKKRTQYISQNPTIVGQVYNGNSEVISIISNKTRDTQIVSPHLELTTDMIDGWLSAPDLGMYIKNLREQGIDNILRKITLTNITSIRPLQDPKRTSIIADLSLMSEYNLDEAYMIFENNVSLADAYTLSKIKDVYDTTTGVLHIKSNIGTFSLLDSANLTVLSYSSSGKRALLKMMLTHPDLFKVPKVNENLKVTQVKPVTEYSGSLSDLIDFS